MPIWHTGSSNTSSSTREAASESTEPRKPLLSLPGSPDETCKGTVAWLTVMLKAQVDQGLGSVCATSNRSTPSLTAQGEDAPSMLVMLGLVSRDSSLSRFQAADLTARPRTSGARARSTAAPPSTTPAKLTTTPGSSARRRAPRLSPRPRRGRGRASGRTRSSS